MKLNKKVLGLALAGTLALSSVSAFAANVPVAKDNQQAFTLMEKFFCQGLYYEAMEMVNQVTAPAEQTYDVDKKALWTAKIQEKIDDYEISEIFAQVENLYFNQNNVLKAREVLSRLDNYDLEKWQFQKAYEWENILKSIKYAKQAIVAVEYTTGTYLDDPSLYYSVVKVANGFDVYVKSYKSDANVYAYNVASNGTVTVDVTNWPGNGPDEINIQ